MALRSPLTVQPYDYIADSNGRPLDYGQIYIGVAGQDPEFYQIPVFLDAEMTKPIDQPIRTNDGFVDFAGSLSELYASAEIYSVKVLDKQGRKVIYKAEMMRNNLTPDILTVLDDAIIEAQQQAVITTAELVNKSIDDIMLGEYRTQLEVKVDGISGDVDTLSDEVSNLSDDVSAQKLDTGITATPQFVDGVATTQAQVNAETVSIERFGVTAASADNTLKMRKAFAYCKANNCTLYFPPKNYSCTNTIYSFHDVEISGKGSIQRGSDIYYIEPSSKQINTIYISSNGNADGLSSSTATSLSFLPQVLKNIGKRSLNGGWKIKMLAGNYTNTGLRFDDVPSFNQRLIIEGEKDFTGTVTTIWNGTTSTEAYAIRADLVCSPLRALFKDIRFEYWEKSTSNAGGIVAWGGHDIITENCYFKNTPIGVWTSRNSQHRSRGDTFDTCVTWGIGCQYSSSVVVGLPTARTKFKNCGKGLHVGRASIGHNDYSDFEDNDYDLYVTQNSRITHLSPTFKRWKYASHYIQNGAINESIDVCDFDAASITYATPILFTENAAVIDKVQSKGMELLHQSYVPLIAARVTGLTEPKDLGSLTGFGSWSRLPKMLFYQGSTISMRVVMRLHGVNAGATNSLSFSAASNLDTREFIRVSLPTGGWAGMLELNFEFRDGGGCHTYGKLTANTANNATYFVSKSLTNSELEAGFIDKTSNLTLWRSYIRLAQPTDEITVVSMKSWVTL